MESSEPRGVVSLPEAKKKEPSIMDILQQLPRAKRREFERKNKIRLGTIVGTNQPITHAVKS